MFEGWDVGRDASGVGHPYGILSDPVADGSLASVSQGEQSPKTEDLTRWLDGLDGWTRASSGCIPFTYNSFLFFSHEGLGDTLQGSYHTETTQGSSVFHLRICGWQ